jgi:hypothetical protein
MNKLKLDSSETTREILLTQFNFEEYLQYGKLEQIKNVNIDFLEWFIGFFEAEGSFSNWFDGKKNRVELEITQKDPKLMYKIKKNLGFGQVTQFSKTHKIYWRYKTSKGEYLKYFIYLFNGNLVSHYKQKMFENFVSNYNKIYGTQFIVFNKNIVPSFKTAWLSGFLEGDGGFYATFNNIIRLNKDGSKSYNFIMKYYITQKNELILLNNIKNLFEISSNIYQIHNGHTPGKYNRLETTKLNCHLLVIKYLEKYPFLGKRKITFLRWKRLVGYKINKYPITDKSILKLKRLISSTKNMC